MRCKVVAEMSAGWQWKLESVKAGLRSGINVDTCVLAHFLTCMKVDIVTFIQCKGRPLLLACIIAISTEIIELTSHHRDEIFLLLVRPVGGSQLSQWFSLRLRECYTTLLSTRNNLM